MGELVHLMRAGSRRISFAPDRPVARPGGESPESLAQAGKEKQFRIEDYHLSRAAASR